MAKSDLEIARAAELLPIAQIAAKIGVSPDLIHPYGRYKAKLDPSLFAELSNRPDGKLVLVTAVSPTPAGEGKTTTTIGLGDGLNAIGKKTMVALREPSLGPCFGMKGGATGGGRAQVVPMDEINLHFTGDFHAISTAHNLLAALIDNHLHWGNSLGIDQRRITWKRVLDMNDRALREIVTGLGGANNGFARESGFDITVASEIMAIFCLSENLQDLERRIGQVIIGRNGKKEPVRAAQLEAAGAMTVLLKDAFNPNLVQTLENNPALIHGGPFANIAHGCNSIVATRTALKLADYVVTEAGFGADLGAEKFLDIKCRKAGLAPVCAVIVATVRALKFHAGVSLSNLHEINVEAVQRGFANLKRHIENIRKFGLIPVVAINGFESDAAIEIDVICQATQALGVTAVPCTHWRDGSQGTRQLAETVARVCDESRPTFQTLYPDELPLWEKIETVAREIYRADGITAESSVRKQIDDWQREGYGHFPVCMAKTPYSFSSDPSLTGAPSGYTIPIREVRLNNGAEFIVAICGDTMTLPGLPRVPAANRIGLSDQGWIEGLS